MIVNVLYDNRQDFMEITQDNLDAIKKTIETSLEVEDVDDSYSYEVSVSFVTNEEIKQLNKQYRNVDSETDVLSFPMDDDDGSDLIVLGDVVLSTQKIIEQANEFGHSLEREMLYLVAHSMLHLLGYDHMQEDEKLEMREQEKEIMKKLQIFK